MVLFCKFQRVFSAHLCFLVLRKRDDRDETELKNRDDCEETKLKNRDDRDEAKKILQFKC